MPDVTGGKGSFGGSARAGRDASNTGTGRSSAERARQAAFEQKNNFTTTQGPTGPVFTSTAGLSQGISVSPGKELQKLNQERASIYNSAAGKWNQSANQRSLANLVNAMAPMGFAMEPPDINRPATFSGGDYHLGWNPGAFAGGILGGLIAPGGGIPAGFLGGKLYDATGLGNVMITGPGDQGMKTWAASRSYSPFAMNASGPSAPAPNAGPSDRTASAGLLPSISQTPQLAAAAQAAQPQASAPAAFTPFGTQTTMQGRFNAVPGPKPYGWMQPAYSFARVPR